MKLFNIVSLQIAVVLLFVGYGFCETEREDFRVGIVLPLSGPLAGMGEAFRRGTELAKADGKTKGIDLIFEDSRYDGKTTISALHKLKASDKVSAVIVWGNTPSGTAAPVAETLQLPMLGISMNPDAKGRKYVVTIGPSIGQAVERIWQQIQIWKLLNPAAASADIGNALLGVNMLKAKMPNGLIIKTFAESENDFKTIIASLKAKAVDGLVLFAAPEQGMTFLKQAHQMNFFPKIVGGDVFAADSFRRVAQALSPNLVFVYGSVSNEFIDRVRSVYGDTSFFFEIACGYLVTTLMENFASRREMFRERPFGDLNEIELQNSPIPDMRYIDDATHGRHLELGMSSYPVAIE